MTRRRVVLTLIGAAVLGAAVGGLVGWVGGHIDRGVQGIKS